MSGKKLEKESVLSVLKDIRRLLTENNRLLVEEAAFAKRVHAEHKFPKIPDNADDMISKALKMFEDPRMVEAYSNAIGAFKGVAPGTLDQLAQVGMNHMEQMKREQDEWSAKFPKKNEQFNISQVQPIPKAQFFEHSDYDLPDVPTVFPEKRKYIQVHEDGECSFQETNTIEKEADTTENSQEKPTTAQKENQS